MVLSLHVSSYSIFTHLLSWFQETNPFTYVEINGLRVSDPTAAYCLLWEGVSGHDVSTDGHLKISAKQSLKNLSRHFSAGGSARGRDGPGGHAWYGLQCFVICV